MNREVEKEVGEEGGETSGDCQIGEVMSNRW